MTTELMTEPSARIDELLAKVRDFMESEVYPLEGPLFENGAKATWPAIEAGRQRAKQIGIWAPHLPEDLGGRHLTLAEFGRLSEELGRSPLGHLMLNCQAPDIGNMELLMEFASPELKERFLMPLARGEVRSCFAMTEPEHAGSNPVMMSTTAVRDGDEYVINGHKWFASSADGASFSIVMAVTNPDADNRYGRASQIVVPTSTPGFRIVRNIPIMGEAGEDYFSHAELMLEDVRVPVTHLVGREGEGFALAQHRLGPGRIHHCMRWIGICERALAMTCERAATRELAPGRPLASRQAVQHWIAESRAEIHASRLMVLDAARRIDEKGAAGARKEISMIKFYVAGVLQRVLDRGIQVHGGLGMTDDTLLSYWFRHERAARIYDGPDEVHKSVVARYELKPYGVSVSL